MSNDKKDLTRIEDLSEFIHELNSSDENEQESFLTETSPEFSSTEEDPFSTPTEQASPFENSAEDFTSTFTQDNPSEFASGSTTDFNSSDFESSFGLDNTENTESSPSWLNEEPTVTETMTESELISQRPEFTNRMKYNSEEEFKAPETFEDLKKFSESSSFTGMATEGNPSFSVLIKNVRFIEDVNDIISLLRELNLLADSEAHTKDRLMRGMLLVPRVSEYAAIFLAHKLRRFDIDIQVGLSDEIHPPKHQETPETGIVSKFNLFQNQSHHFHFDDPKLELSQIIVAAAPSLEGYQVLKYMGVASEHKMLDSQVVEDESSEDVPLHYQELAKKLKAHALKVNANAVVGLNYQLTPIPSEFGISGHKYRLTCTGNLVWVNKL